MLVAVADITARVDLARELTASQSQAQAQVDTLLGILHVEPTQLASFLSDSDASMKMINAVLREPAREEAAFRRKLDSLFRQAHSVKGEAASLGLSSIESRAHAFEDDLKGACARNRSCQATIFCRWSSNSTICSLTCNRSAIWCRACRNCTAAGRPAHVSTPVHARSRRPSPAPPDLAPMLHRLAARIAGENDKGAALRVRRP